MLRRAPPGRVELRPGLYRAPRYLAGTLAESRVPTGRARSSHLAKREASSRGCPDHSVARLAGAGAVDREAQYSAARPRRVFRSWRPVVPAMAPSADAPEFGARSPCPVRPGARAPLAGRTDLARSRRWLVPEACQ